jgi:hypothetical protein
MELATFVGPKRLLLAICVLVFSPVLLVGCSSGGETTAVEDSTMESAEEGGKEEQENAQYKRS